MTEFKQIVGRGTRVHEDTKKFYFTLIDFRGATSHFADPDFDGDPVQIYEPGEGDPITPPDDAPNTPHGGEEPPPIFLAPMKPSSISRACCCREGETSARFTSMALAPASSPSASNISMRTANLSPNPFATSPRLHSRSTSPALTISLSGEKPPSASRRSSRNWKPRASRSTPSQPS
jgi:hypothetical protein